MSAPALAAQPAERAATPRGPSAPAGARRAASWAAVLFVVGTLAGWQLYDAALQGAADAEAPTALPAQAGGAGEVVPVHAIGGPSADAVAALQRHLERNPRDARALVLLARQHLASDRFAEAARAYERALAASPKVARDAGVWVELAEAKGLEQGATLAGAPLELVHKALAIDALHPRALDLAGSAAYEARDYALAVSYWTRLLAQIPEGDVRRVELQTAIDGAERRARFALPPRN